MEENIQIVFIIMVILIIVLSLTSCSRLNMKDSNCPYSCNCQLCNKKYVLKGDNNLYLAENGFFKYGKSDCRTHWRIMPVGLGKVVLKSLHNDRFLGRCPDPCTEAPPSASANIKSCDIRCNSDGHFTILDNRNGTISLIANNGQYLSRCAACGPDNQDKMVLISNLNPTCVFTLETL